MNKIQDEIVRALYIYLYRHDIAQDHDICTLTELRGTLENVHIERYRATN